MAGFDNRAMTISPMTDRRIVECPAPITQPSLQTQLRDLETEIHDLLVISSRIQNDLFGSHVDQERSPRRSERELTNIQDSLGSEYRLLQSWIEGNRTVHSEDVERMRSGLNDLRQRLRHLDISPIR